MLFAVDQAVQQVTFSTEGWVAIIGAICMGLAMLAERIISAVATAYHRRREQEAQLERDRRDAARFAEMSNKMKEVKLDVQVGHKALADQTVKAAEGKIGEAQQIADSFEKK